MTERLNVRPIESRVNIGGHLVVSEDFMVPYTGNRLIFGTTETGLEVVAKVSQHRKMHREWIGQLSAFSAAVPCPEPLMLGKIDDNHSALVSLRIFGKNMFYSSDLDLRHELGTIVKKMHMQAMTKGDEWLRSGKSDFSYYVRKMDIWRSGNMDDVTTQSLLSQLSISASEYVAGAMPVFNHNDIHDGQVIIPDVGGVVLIDFGNWCEDIPLNDIAFYLFHNIRNNNNCDRFFSFMDGYLSEGKLSDQEKVVILFELLFISTRAVEYFTEKKSNYLTTAKETHKRVLAYIEEEILFK